MVRAVDVLVVGAGPVGAAAALAAANLGYDIAVVERHRPQRHCGELGMDLRTLALAPASRAQIEALTVWPNLVPVPYHSMRVWEERGAAELRFAAADVGRAELGWILEASRLKASLWQQLESNPGVACIVGECPQLLASGEESVTLKLGGEQLQARLVVAADGARSAVRGQIGVGIRELATDQQALATIARTGRPHLGVACQRFLLDGPLALLPGKDPHTVSVVWSQSAAMAEQRKLLDDGEFCAALADASGKCFGDITAVDRRLQFPVSQMIAESMNPHPRILLIGDAARVVHPLAGLGVNLGFEDVAGFARVLRGAAGSDPGAHGLWRTFARRRRVRGIGMMRFLASLRGLYGLRQPLPNWLRNAGVRFVDAARPAKRQLIREALGIGPIARTLT